MDEVVKKLASLGLPGIVLLITTAATGGVGGAAGLTAAITALGGPLGIVGGVGLLGIMTVIGDVIAQYGVENVLAKVYVERGKTESVKRLLKEIKDLPITPELKLKLQDRINAEVNSSPQVYEVPKTVEIVDE